MALTPQQIADAFNRLGVTAEQLDKMLMLLAMRDQLLRLQGQIAVVRRERDAANQESQLEIEALSAQAAALQAQIEAL